MPDRLTRLAYGLGAVPFGAKLQLFGLLLLFYNQLLGLPVAAVSAVLAASVVLDAVWDMLDKIRFYEVVEAEFPD